MARRACVVLRGSPYPNTIQPPQGSVPCGGWILFYSALFRAGFIRRRVQAGNPRALDAVVVHLKNVHLQAVGPQ